MAYASSDKIKVFPTSNRGTINKNGSQQQIDPEARLNTEGNLTGILKHATDGRSFILNATEENDAIASIEFVINGYYFNLTDGEILKNSELWASITISDSESGETLSGRTFSALDGTDNDPENIGKYTGITFYNSELVIPESIGEYRLQLLSNSEVVFDNYTKFRTNEYFRSVYIDDGDLG